MSRDKEVSPLLDRKELPGILKLSYKFDISKILAEFKPFSDYSKYLDLDGQSSQAEYGELCRKKSDLHSKFLHDTELAAQENTAHHSQYYKQLALTELNSDLLGISKRPKDPKGELSRHKRAQDHDSEYYDPLIDERNYSKRKSICTGYWNEILDAFKAPVTRTRFAYMAPHFSIKPHIDYNTTYSIRVHIPIVTNPHAFLCFRDSSGKIERHHYPADGSVYFLNTGIQHWAENNGDSERVHLIISLNGQDDLPV